MSQPALVNTAIGQISGDTVLAMRNVSRVHGHGAAAVTALNGVNVTVQLGELVAIMGASGSGKSTLLNLAGALDTPTDGTVAVGGVEVSLLDATGQAALRRREVGYVFQDLNLIPALTALENVILPLELDGVPTKQAKQIGLTALAELDVAELANRFPDDMSGGQAQRVAIARALVGPRRLLLADEPTGALDSVTGEAIMRVLRARVDAGAAGLLVTHDARNAAWADRIIFLKDGLIIDQTEPEPGPESLLVD